MAFDNLFCLLTDAEADGGAAGGADVVAEAGGRAAVVSEFAVVEVGGEILGTSVGTSSSGDKEATEDVGMGRVVLVEREEIRGGSVEVGLNKDEIGGPTQENVGSEVVLGEETETVTAVVERGTNGTASMFSVWVVVEAGLVVLVVLRRTLGVTAGGSGWEGG